ncbi:MAG: hypothetical protein U1D66_00290, partial [Erythrobacter sp.]|nr:hypothetical protein [Erythrobacter sp.]
IDALYRRTDGIPRRVNQVMNRLLLLGAIEERGELTPAMLDEVMAEMAADQTRGAQGNGSDLRAAPVAATAAPDCPDSLPATEVAALLAARDARTAELEAAISELQAAGTGQRDAAGDPLSPEDARIAEAQLAEALERIEVRLEEQEQSFRHVLTMLIEWLEEDPSREAA